MATEFIVPTGPGQSGYTSLDTALGIMDVDYAAAGTRVFPHGGITGTVGDAASVTGQSSSATGTVTHCTSTQILLTGISGTFTNGEEVRVTAGNSVTISSAGDAAPTGVCECATTGAADTLTSNGTISTSLNTSATERLIVRAHADHYASAIFDTGKYYLNSSGSGSIEHIEGNSLNGEYVRVEGIQIDVAATGNNADGITILNSHVELHRCHIKCTGAGTGGFGIYMGSLIDGTITSLIIRDFGSDGFYMSADANSSIVCANCTSVGNNDGFKVGWDDTKCLNCLGIGNDVESFDDGDTAHDAPGSDYNCVDDTKAPGANSTESATIIFATGADNFNLHANDTDAVGAGVGPSADADCATEDINGQAISGATCDCGAAQVIAIEEETVESVELLLGRPAFGISTQDVYDAVIDLPGHPRVAPEVHTQDQYTGTAELGLNRPAFGIVADVEEYAAVGLTIPTPSLEAHSQDLLSAVVELALTLPQFETHSQDLESLIAGLALLTPSYEVSTLDQETLVAELLLPRPAFGVVADVEEYAAVDLALTTPAFGVTVSVTEYGTVTLVLPTVDFNVQATVGETLAVAFTLDRPGFGVQVDVTEYITVGFALSTPSFNAFAGGNAELIAPKPSFSLYGDVQIMGAVGLSLSTPSFAVTAPNVIDTNVAHALETPLFAVQATYVGDLEGYHVERRYYEKPSRIMKKRIR